VAISFDTTGLRQLDQSTWLNPATGDQIGLQLVNVAPDLPAALEDLPRLRHELTILHGQDGCLIEAVVVNFGGLPCLIRVLKMPLPDQPAGQLFTAVITVPRATASASLQIVCPERGTTGVREATLMAQLGPQNWLLPHPYAPGFTGLLPYHAGDDPRWDAQFADHALSRARAWLHHAVRTARVDPSFAALPPFTQPASGDLPAPAHAPPSQATPPPAAPASAAPVDGPAAGSRVTTVVAGIPVAGFLPIWLAARHVVYWRLDDPGSLLARLGRGTVARAALAGGFFRETLLLDPDGPNLSLPDRQRSGDGGITATAVPGRPAVEGEAEALVTQEAKDAAFAWVGEIYAEATERNECLMIGPGGVEMYGRPSVLMLASNGDEPVSTITASPAPIGAPLWRDMLPPEEQASSEDEQSISGPIVDPEMLRVAGRPALHAVETWPVSVLDLSVSFRPTAGG
jgi:hypothetical protein